MDRAIRTSRTYVLGLLALVLFVLCAGCADAGGGLAVGALLLALGVAGCAREVETDAGDIDAALRDAPGASLLDVPGATLRDASDDGYCVPCCGYAPDPVHGCCWCSAGSSCNYGMGCWSGVDGGNDAGGTLEPCCLVDDGGVIGMVSTCFCAAGTTCAFSFVDCGDGACTMDDGGTCPTDAGP